MLAITYLDPSRVEAPHEATDDGKVNSLAESMRTNGWQGPPIVIVERDGADPIAVTGSHRISAAVETNTDVPAVSLAALAAEHGLDLARLVTDYQAAGLGEDSAIYEAAARAVDHIPADVVAHYGLDLH